MARGEPRSPAPEAHPPSVSWPLVAALCLICLASTDPAHATRTPTLDLDTLLSRSALIFDGVVTEVDVTAGVARGKASTRVVFRLDTVLRGESPGSHLTLDLPEGFTPDGRLVETVETPRFAAGHRYIVFLRSGSWRFSPVTDWQQGALRMVAIKEHRVLVRGSGHCVSDLDRRRLHFGPRVAPQVQWPGFPATAGQDPPRPDKAAGCAPADDVARRLVARIDELGLVDRFVEPARTRPADDLRYTPTAPPAHQP